MAEAREGAAEAPGGAGPEPPSRRARWLLFALLAAISVLPVALVRYPPVLDLAQQMAQFPLLEKALGPDADRYSIEWLAPNRISYPLLGLGWLLGGAEDGARVGLALCLIAILGAIHALGAAFGRPLASVALASVFVWSSSFYGGFFNYLLGGWGLVLWLRELDERQRARSGREAFLRAAGVALIFYLSHLFWLAAALGLLIVEAVRREETRRFSIQRATALLPFLLAGWLWELASRDPARPRQITWVRTLWQRVSTGDEWASYFLGGLKGWIEPAVLLLILIWLAVAWWRNRTETRTSLWRQPLASAAAVFFVAVLVLPDTVDEVWWFGRRWGVWTGICMTLALPRLRFGRRPELGLALVVVAVLTVLTARNWVDFDRSGMRGFEACRSAVPAGARLLQLDFLREHPRFWIYPTFQMAAYVQLDRQAELGFSFAEHRSSLVTFREPRRGPWTPMLEHFPGRIRPGDFDHFDLVLLHLPEWAVEQLPERLPRLIPFEGEGQWRLCRVRPPAPVSAGGAP